MGVEPFSVLCRVSIVWAFVVFYQQIFHGGTLSLDGRRSMSSPDKK